MTDEFILAQEFKKIALDALKDADGVHAETAIACLARMAGMFLFLSFGFPMKDMVPGQTVLSSEANEKGPELITVLSKTLADLGIHIPSEKLTYQASKENSPKLSVIETEKLLRRPLTDISEKHHASLEMSARAAAIATGMLISDAVTVLDPAVGYSVAVYGFVEGSKTVPVE